MAGDVQGCVRSPQPTICSNPTTRSAGSSITTDPLGNMASIAAGLARHNRQTEPATHWFHAPPHPTPHHGTTPAVAPQQLRRQCTATMHCASTATKRMRSGRWPSPRRQWAHAPVSLELCRTRTRATPADNQKPDVAIPFLFRRPREAAPVGEKKSVQLLSSGKSLVPSRSAKKVHKAKAAAASTCARVWTSGIRPSPLHAGHPRVTRLVPQKRGCLVQRYTRQRHVGLRTTMPRGNAVDPEIKNKPATMTSMASRQASCHRTPQGAPRNYSSTTPSYY